MAYRWRADGGLLLCASWDWRSANFAQYAVLRMSVMKTVSIQGGSHNVKMLSSHDIIGVTIAAKNDYCDSIGIAGSTIAILLLLWTTIAILLYCDTIFWNIYACLK